MPALIESLFSVREVPWHGLGTILEDAPTSKDAIVAAGLDWNVRKDPIYVESGDEIKGFKATIRETDGAVLGIVSNKYRVVQNSEAFQFTDNLIGEGATYETAGSLQGGKRVWLLAKLEGTKVAGDAVDPYLVFSNSFDGSGAIKVALTPVRVVCNNTLRAALSGAKRTWSAPHTGDIKLKLQEAEETLFNAQRYMKELDVKMTELRKKELTKNDINSLTEMIFPINPKDEEENAVRKIKVVEEKRSKFLYRFYNAPDLSDMKDNAYKFINAVSDFECHEDPSRRTANFEENRFIKIIDGGNLFDKAYSLLVA